MVDGRHLGPLRVVRFDADRANLDAGVADEDVDRAVGLFHSGDEVAPRVGIGDVVIVVGASTAGVSQLAGEPLSGIGRDVGDGDGGALAREETCVRCSHALGGSGDQRDLAGYAALVVAHDGPCGRAMAFPGEVAFPFIAD